MEQDIVQLQRLSQGKVHLSLPNIPGCSLGSTCSVDEPLATFPLLFLGCDSCYFMESLVTEELRCPSEPLSSRSFLHLVEEAVTSGCAEQMLSVL